MTRAAFRGTLALPLAALARAASGTLALPLAALAHSVLRGALVLLLAVLMPTVAEACAVCFGAADSKLTEGMNNGILALLGFIALVQVGFVALFLRFRHRSKKLAERRDSLHLIRGGSP